MARPPSRAKQREQASRTRAPWLLVPSSPLTSSLACLSFSAASLRLLAATCSSSSRRICTAFDSRARRCSPPGSCMSATPRMKGALFGRRPTGLGLGGGGNLHVRARRVVLRSERRAHRGAKAWRWSRGGGNSAASLCVGGVASRTCAALPPPWRCEADACEGSQAVPRTLTAQSQGKCAVETAARCLPVSRVQVQGAATLSSRQRV